VRVAVATATAVHAERAMPAFHLLLVIDNSSSFFACTHARNLHWTVEPFW
jgi:hypothetical protein